MQKHIKEVEKNKDSKYVFYDYAKDKKQENCNSLKGKKVLVNKNTLYKMARKNPNKSFSKGAIATTGVEGVSKAILNEEDVLIGVPFLSHYQSSTALFYKILINTKTYEIISCTNRATAINEFLRIDLKSISNCD